MSGAQGLGHLSLFICDHKQNVTINKMCSLKPYNIKGKSITTNPVHCAVASYQL